MMTKHDIDMIILDWQEYLEGMGRRVEIHQSDRRTLAKAIYERINE